MAVSVDAIRRLNKMKFIVECCDDPAEGLLNSASSTSTDQTTQSGVSPSGGTSSNSFGSAWTFSLYSDAGLRLDGSINQGDFLNGLLKSNKLVQTGARYASITYGIVPQIDIARKYLFNGTTPLSFSVSLYCVLDEDPVADLLAPVLRLAYLTYPHRYKSVDEIPSQIVAFIRNFLGKLESKFISPAIQESSLYKMVKGAGEFVFDTAEAFFDTYLTDASLLRMPPTFNMNSVVGASNSGLSLRYGSILLTDIYFKGMSIEIPTLFYEGGFPPYIKVTMSCETLRVMTYDLLLNILSGVIDDGNPHQEAVNAYWYTPNAFLGNMRQATNSLLGDGFVESVENFVNNKVGGTPGGR